MIYVLIYLLEGGYCIKMSLQEYKEQDNYFDKWCNRIKDRLLNKNQNWLGSIIGGTGSGKTYAALSIARYLVGDSYDVSKYVVFNAKQFMTVLTSDYIKAGDMIIWDEAGVGMSSKDWYSLQNKLINYVFQTFRHRNIAVLFTMPAMKFLDNSARLLMHANLETVHIHRKEELNQIKVFDVEYNNKVDKVYYKFPCFIDEDGNSATLKYLYVKKPKAKDVNVYEKMKEEYTTNLNKDILATLDAPEKVEPKKPEPCPICLSAFWRFNKTDSIYMCKKCGHTQTKNPWERTQP